jgi:cation diffusion facilitator family transporter
MTTFDTGSAAVRDDAIDRRAANRAMAVSAAGLAVTALLELGLAVVTGSVALLGDALHNLSDVSTSAVVFAGFWVSRRPATTRYPYGYERAEDLAGLGVAMVIWASAVFAGYESVHKLLDAAPTNHPGLGMVGAAFGVVGNQLVARYKLTVGRRIRSATLVADAKHSWLDAISSVGALGGLVLVALGYRWGDPVAGFAVTLFICHVGVEVTRELLHHLMDGVDPDDLDAARTAAVRVDGVRAADVRGRWMGRTLLLEVETRLDDGLNLADADLINTRVEEGVRAAVPAVGHVHSHAHGALGSG